VGKVEQATLNATLFRLNRILRAAGMSWERFGEELDAALKRV
jgi:hypothetical protein